MFVPRPGWRARMATLAVLFAYAAAAQPPLTTIRDVLFKADGTRFNGYVVINWNSFEAGDTSNIATQFRAVRIVDGNLQVKLVPTTNADPPATYTAKYNSDGKVQFEETWAVPPSSAPLRLRDVRISAPPNVETFGLPIQETDVVGLVGDLLARPKQGPGYATGRVLTTNASGDLEAVSGVLSDCVRVDGSSGPCGSGGAPSFVDGETPTGVVDGANCAFGLSGTPSPAASAAVYRNGVLQKPGQDFTITQNNLQFLPVSAPQPGDTLLVSYRLAGGAAAPTGSATVEALCSSTGGNTSSTDLTSLGTCTISAGTLKAGDRVEIRFDFAHSGSSAGFQFAVRWAGVTLLERTATAADAMVSGRAEAGIAGAETQLSAQSWGTALSFAATVTQVSAPLTAPIGIDFLGNMTQTTGDALSLRTFTVLRYTQ